MRVGALQNRQLSSRVFKALLILLVFTFVALEVPQSVGASTPSAPQYVEAMADSNQVAVTWDPPSSNGGDSLLSYTARVWTVPPPTTSPVFASCVTINLGCIIGGLISGATYYVDVFASNSAGIGTPSAVKAISPGNAGKPPSDVSATSDNKGLLTIKWTPLTSFSSGTFAWYTAEVFASPDISIGSYSGFCTESSITGSSCLIGGLKLGTKYYAQVRTLSSLGSSFPSFPRFQITAGTAANPSPSSSATATNSNAQPTPPQLVKAIALSKSVRVSWRPPTKTGGMKILGYRVGAYGASGALLSSCKTSAKIYTCTILKLKAKQAIYIGVVAIFSGVDSPSSKLIPIIPKS